MPHDTSISEAKGADGLKCQPKSGLGTHWIKTLLRYRGSKVAPGWLIHERCEFWASLPKAKADCSWARTFLKTGHWPPWWRMVTANMGVPGPMLPLLFNGLLATSSFSRAFSRNKSEERHQCVLQQFLQVGMAKGVRLKSGDPCSIYYCAINCPSISGLEPLILSRVCGLSGLSWAVFP